MARPQPEQVHGSEPERHSHLDDEVLEVEDKFYILATSSRTDDRTRVLKHGDTFALFDRFGDVQPVGLGEQGIYDEGTRHLSRLELRLGGRRPLLLSSTVRKENDILTVDLTNPDITRDGAVVLPRGQVHLFRSKVLWQGVCYEHVRITNFGLTATEMEILLLFDADYADIFEVRGIERIRRGQRLDPEVNATAVVLGYRGLDDVTRRTRLTFDPPPSRLSASGVRWNLRIAPHDTVLLTITTACERDGVARSIVSYDEATHGAHAELRKAVRAFGLRTDHELFNQWVDQSATDLHMMVTDTAEGPYPYAGVPWFSTPFGRDAIITALEVLWLQPALARGVLRYLAGRQATKVVPEQDAEPGKILHESRRGEMAALGEVPFGEYYGSVDSTPLFVMLAGAYFDRTADRAFAEELWPNVERAIGWIDGPGDPDGDGFLEYARQKPTGLANQGWKDSHDSVSHADGTLADGPIALCEVQGYAYAARRAAARMARALGRPDREIDELERRAARLRALFEDKFWLEDQGTYALALDGSKRACAVRSSNAGHALFTGISSAERARRTGDTLLDAGSFSGWGIRTLAAGEVRYNPMSYHNGSVWPHDNALIAAGLARYGLHNLVLGPVEGLFQASLYVDLHRLPELFCGFPRRPGEGPTLYPVACAPQAWASGAVYMLVAALLGMSIDAAGREITFDRPCLPEFLNEVRITRLPIADATVDLLFERHPHDVGLTVLRREGQVTVSIRK